ncbi:MAG TPA: isoprenylcysteine carboxylmethyltransferase family protein [Candidatus Acidoferrales bacterium]|nr:isoprenylcysteine carboxylmethyltransferase family protein [Candidatus Acidoferrales bacterium]
MGRVRILILGCIRTAVIALPLFVAAGRLDVPAFWEYLGVFFVFIAAAAFLLDPDMLKERMRPGGKRPSAGLFVVMVLYVVQLLAAGLDAGRFHWTPAIPVGVQLGGLGGFVLGMSLILWAMRTNRFFSSVVRLQTDRGHTLVTGGPYRWVRHPGYTAMLLLCVCNGVAMGSWAGEMISLLFLPLLFYRILTEDAFLKKNLPGYEEYAARVRQRLVPGVW